eukprot:GHRQ01000293.1.p1 GENE.GHRQ01000293.1~~GHRQ01000293.1.p1  ORF type:complete len:683 (+),score=280.20 GHRQ01000293.1:407-2455(+)
MATTYFQQQHYTDDTGTLKKKVPSALQAAAATPLPHSSADEPATPRAALHSTPGAPMVSPAAVAHAEAAAIAVARQRWGFDSVPPKAAVDTVQAANVPLDTEPETAGAGEAYHFPAAARSPPRAASARVAARATPKAAVARVAERGAAALGRTGGRLSKYASQTGLDGVAEAAGHVLGELTPCATWRQEVLLTRLAAGLTLALTLGYVLLLAPRSLGWRAELHLVRSFGADNAVAFALVNLLGLLPAMLGCVAWPLLRSAKNKPRLWRYILASTMTGAFALLSYLAAWDPPAPGKAARLPPQHLAGRSRRLQRAHESRLYPATLLASSCAMIALAANSSAATWAQFGYLASHSFSFHVMLLDFSLLTLLSAWLVSKDAAARAWPPAATPTGRRLLRALMLLTPVVGPGVYLLLRPISREGGVLRRGWLRRAAAAAWAAVTRPFSLPAGGVGGRPGGAASGAALGRPAHSTSSRSQGGSGSGVVGGHRSSGRADVAAALTHAAEVPLPAAGAAGAALGSAGQWLESAWGGGWSALGQQVARMRGGGAPVASDDDVAGAELDAMDDGEVQIEGTGTTHSNSAAAAAPVTPTAFAGLSLPKLGALLFPHVQQQQQQGWALGPAAPVKGKDDEDGTDLLLFSDEYDEYEYDFEASSSDDDEGGDESAEWEADSGEEEADDDEDFEP